MKLFAGIDGGGTRTRLALVGEDGTLLSYVEGASCDFIEHGLEQARDELARLWRAAWQRMAEPARAADAFFMGMGSILAGNEARTNCELAETLGFVRPGCVRAENDAYSALAGGLCGRPGILLIAGTGSACFGRNVHGQIWRAGGWGYRLHDVGSAYALGLAAMIAATRDADGRDQPTALTSMVREALGIQEMAEMYRRVHQDKLDRADVAALAPHVMAIATAGDSVARRILSNHADGLVEMVVTVACRLQLGQPSLALTGGLITGAVEFRQLFLECLERALPGFMLARDGFTPVLGSVLLAVEFETGATPGTAFIENLRRTSTAVTELAR